MYFWDWERIFRIGKRVAIGIAIVIVAIIGMHFLRGTSMYYNPFATYSLNKRMEDFTTLTESKDYYRLEQTTTTRYVDAFSNLQSELPINYTPSNSETFILEMDLNREIAAINRYGGNSSLLMIDGNTVLSYRMVDDVYEKTEHDLNEDIEGDFEQQIYDLLDLTEDELKLRNVYKDSKNTYIGYCLVGDFLSEEDYSYLVDQLSFDVDLSERVEVEINFTSDMSMDIVYYFPTFEARNSSTFDLRYRSEVTYYNYSVGLKEIDYVKLDDVD